MKELKPGNLIFNDTEATRTITSDKFNFALDKESGISVCWGENINDTPEYDPISPEELIFKIDNKFNLETYLNMFNILGNIKIKLNQTENGHVVEFHDIESNIEALQMKNLVALSTLASVVLIFDSSFLELDFSELNKFTTYVKKFVPIIVQLNSDYEISYEQLAKLKLLSMSIQIKTGNELNANQLVENLKVLKSNNINTSVKLFVNKNIYNEALKLIELIDKEIAVKVYFNLPYVTTKQYTDLQKKFNKLRNS